jgi:hypothetical protein
LLVLGMTAPPFPLSVWTRILSSVL